MDMEIKVVTNCLICKTSFKKAGTNIFQETTKYSKSPFIQILNEIQKIEFVESSEFGSTCSGCITKLNKYDLAIVNANKIRQEIIQLIEKSGSVLHFPLPTILQNTNKTIKQEPEMGSSEEELNIDCTTNPKNKVTKLHNKGILLQKSVNNSTNKKFNINFKNMKLKLRIKNMKYACNECGLKFPNKYSQQCHQQNHIKKNLASTTTKTNLLDFKCDHCDFISKTESILNGHKKNHHGSLKPFKCSSCEKRFVQVSSLNRHLYVHTGEKRFQCEKCGKKFGEYSSFRMHILAHDNIKDKECTICGLKFRSTSHLKRHIMVHSKEKPHKCPNCSKSFAQRYNMNFHLRKYCDINKIKEN